MLDPPLRPKRGARGGCVRSRSRSSSALVPRNARDREDPMLRGPPLVTWADWTTRSGASPIW